MNVNSQALKDHPSAASMDAPLLLETAMQYLVEYMQVSEQAAKEIKNLKEDILGMLNDSGEASHTSADLGYRVSKKKGSARVDYDSMACDQRVAEFTQTKSFIASSDRKKIDPSILEEYMTVGEPTVTLVKLKETDSLF